MNGAYVRVHHWARQAASPMPLLAAMAARTKRIEVGTGVIDMRYENPFQFAEEAAALDLISDGRIALGVSRGSPETALRGYETFGYVDEEDTERGSVIAREKFDLFLRAIDGEGIAPGDPRMVGAGRYLAIEPQSPTLRDHIWWGSGSRPTAIETGRKGLNMMSSTLVTEATGQPFHELQREQIDLFRSAYKEAGHTGTPRVSVSRSVFPLVSDMDRALLRPSERGECGSDRHHRRVPLHVRQDLCGRARCADRAASKGRGGDGRGHPDADDPEPARPEYNLHVLESFAKHVAPALGWKPNTEGPVQGDPV